jgi:HK97 family phage major capsid protein
MTATQIRDVRDRAAIQPFQNAGEYLFAVREAAITPAKTDIRLRWLNDQLSAATGLGEAVDSEGGFIVPPMIAEPLLQKVYDDSEILGRCNKTPAGSNEVILHAIDETSRVDGSRFGGLRGYWVAEGATVTASKPKFRQLRMRLAKVAAALYVTEEGEDSVSFGSRMQTVVPAELRFQVENAILRGDGAGKPLGVLNAPCVIEVSKESGQGANTFEFENTTAMYARCWTASRKNAVWLVGGDVDVQLLSMMSGIAGTPALTYEGGRRYLHGGLVLPCEHCSTVGDVGDVVLADLSQYELTDRDEVNGVRSIHVKFLEHESVYRFSYRVQGQPGWNAPLTPRFGSDTQSPFITLEARA